MALPLEQVIEAQVYYQTHRDLIVSEAAEEKRKLAEQEAFGF